MQDVGTLSPLESPLTILGGCFEAGRPARLRPGQKKLAPMALRALKLK
jgi:hypothetical protein